MMILVEPGPGDKPIRRRRGRGRKWLKENNKLNQGTMKDFFSKIQIPKECLDQQMVEKEGGERKRMVEEEDEKTEQMMEPTRTKTKLTTIDLSLKPDGLTVPGEILLERGPKSLCGREPMERLKMGAMDLGMIGLDLMERNLEDSRGIKTDGREKL